MTYQRFSGVRVVSGVCSVIIVPALGWPREQPDRALEDRVEDGDVETHGEADREDEHGQVAGLLPSRPGDLLELGPGLVDETANATHVVLSSLSYVLLLKLASPRAEAASPRG